MDAIDELVHTNLVRMYHEYGRTFQYLRIDPILSEHQRSLSMDNTEPRALEELERIGDHLAASRSAEIERFLSLLIKRERFKR